ARRARPRQGARDRSLPQGGPIRGESIDGLREDPAHGPLTLPHRPRDLGDRGLDVGRTRSGGSGIHGASGPRGRAGGCAARDGLERAMWIVRLALRRPYTFIVMALLIAIGGVLTIARTPVDIF